MLRILQTRHITLSSTLDQQLVHCVSNLIQHLHGPTQQTAEDNNKFARHISAY